MIPAHPDARFLFKAIAFNPPLQECMDQDLFQLPYILLRSRAIMRQLEDGIAHDLSRSMIGNRAATVYGREAGACPAEDFAPAGPMCWLGGTAHGIDWRMFKEHQYIPLSLRNPFLL
jgi:hypothetical protein